MKFTLLTLFLSVFFNIFSQNFKSPPQRYSKNIHSISLYLKQRTPTYIGMFASGMADGLSENLKWKYHRFQTTFPNANPQYWNPYDSWDNKWKNGDPLQGERFFGSSTFLAWTTDGYHFYNTTSRFLMRASFIINLRQIRNYNWKVMVLDFAISTTAFGLGWHFTDKIILN